MAEKESPNDHLARHDREISKIRNEKLIPVSERHEGLMQPQDKSDMIHALGMREWIGKKISVFDLAEGYYETTWNNLTDTPVKEYESAVGSDAPYCEIDVRLAITNGGTRKQILFYSSSTGEMWYRNTHESPAGVNDTPRLWRAFESRTLLWSGNVSNVGSTITLADSLANYTRVEIGYGALRRPERSDFDLGGYITLHDFNMPSDDGLWTAFYETVLSNNGNKTMTITQANGILRNSSGTPLADTNKISITSVRGVR